MGHKSHGFILHAIKCCRARRQTLFSLLLTLAAKRRRQLIGLSLILLALHRNSVNSVTARSVKRLCRRLKCNIGWWKTVSSTYSASRFKKTFRISRGTFDFTLEIFFFKHIYFMSVKQDEHIWISATILPTHSAHVQT